MNEKLKTCETFKLEGFSDIEVVECGLDYYVQRIAERRGFAFIKRTHGFWDLLVDLMLFDSWYEDKCAAQGEVSGKKEAMVEYRNILQKKTIYKSTWDSTFIDELIEDLYKCEEFDDSNFFEAISFRGYNREGEHLAKVDVPLGTIYASRFCKEDLRQALLTYCPNQPRWHDALVWKDAVFTGELNSLIEVLKGMEVILVGPPHLATLGEILGLRRFHHISIHPTEAIGDRTDMLAETLKFLDRPSAEPKICLFQSGVIAFWLIYRLYEKYPEAFYLDLGRTLDLWYPEVVSLQGWFKYNKKQIVKSMKLEELYP